MNLNSGKNPKKRKNIRKEGELIIAVLDVQKHLGCQDACNMINV
jgi:hypothetical protein